MAWGKIKVTEQTGKFAYQITDYIIKECHLDNASAQFRCRLEELIRERNNNWYQFQIGEEIIVPEDQREAILSVTEPLPMVKKGVSYTTSHKGWKLVVQGQEKLLVQGSTGWFTDENGLYILKDGRRVTEKEAEKPENINLRFGDDDPSTGFENIFNFRKPRGNIYNTVDIYNEIVCNGHIDKVHVVVFQALQINLCYCTDRKISFNNGKNRINSWSIGEDETRIPIVVTQVGNANASNKLVIAGPHGDERNAQRLIMAAQKHFIQQRTAPNDMVMYFIPCISPTMAFADARGIPVVKIDEKGKVTEKFSAENVLNKVVLTIPYLHDLIAKQLPDPNDPSKTIVLRTLIQENNGTAFTSYENYHNGIIAEDYPSYGIDANRDVGLWLESTKQFLDFIGKLKGSTSGENIKVIMIHGYIHRGGVYGAYKINENLSVELVSNEAKDFAYAFWEYLFTGKLQKYFPGTENAPLNFAGEWSQLLFNKHDILSVDIELPKETYDEGRRGDLTPGNNYKHNIIKEDFENKGILTTGREGFYKLLETYSAVIDEYIKTKNKNKKV